MTYHGQDYDFIKPSYCLTLFEANSRHFLGALLPFNAIFEFLCVIFASQKFYNFTHCLGGGHL